ncbi:MAG TPA: DUF2398 family protein, partial [Polyangiaceae bacterium]|nr:DUF2398 family protein [Polyangiaceae bacterium]
MPSDHHPQAMFELRECARHLVQRPLTCKEHDPDLFRLLRRHETDLDRWFTQRFGYRLHVDVDTARLFKTGALPARRPLRARTGRAFLPLEYTLLALVLGATVAGPAVISLRDLVQQVRSAAGEAEVAMDDSSATRRALVAVLQWMIEHGLASELHAGIDAYAGDAAADAVLRFRPDRIALLPLPALVGAESPEELLDRAEHRSATRQWMRCRLVEEPVLYRSDLREAEWSELRRRLGEEAKVFDEMFGLTLEARAEGVAAIDPEGSFAARRFPATGTVGHAALLLIEALRSRAETAIEWSELVDRIEELGAEHRRGWSKDLVAAPERLARQVV